MTGSAAHLCTTVTAGLDSVCAIAVLPVVEEPFSKWGARKCTSKNYGNFFSYGPNTNCVAWTYLSKIQNVKVEAIPPQKLGGLGPRAPPVPPPLPLFSVPLSGHCYVILRESRGHVMVFMTKKWRSFWLKKCTILFLISVESQHRDLEVMSTNCLRSLPNSVQNAGYFILFQWELMMPTKQAKYILCNILVSESLLGKDSFW